MTGIGDHHLTAHLAEDRGADINDDRILVHEHGQQVAREHDKGDAKAEAEEQEEQVAVRRAADGKHVVQGHGDVGNDDDLDRLPDGRCLALMTVLRRALDEQLHGDPEDQNAADELHIAQDKQLRDEEGEHHAQKHRGGRAEQDALLPLFVGKRADGHGNDHGVVAGEDEVDDDDAEEGRQERQVEADVSEHTEVHDSAPGAGLVSPEIEKALDGLSSRALHPVK